MGGVTIVDLQPVPRFLWWALRRRVAPHKQLAQFFGLLAETTRREGWLDFDPQTDWLPAADRTDLLGWTAAADRR
ncbi:hypothetical protein JOD67_007012 [Tenggerimyces flavus]|nr:hypothetical protein [Tenggerimyces flavus]